MRGLVVCIRKTPSQRRVFSERTSEYYFLVVLLVLGVVVVGLPCVVPVAPCVELELPLACVWLLT